VKSNTPTKEDRVEKRSDGLIELEERYAGYEVYDRHGEKIGKVDDLFVNQTDQPEYIGVKMGFLGTKATLIPIEVVRVDEGQERIEVSAEKDHVKVWTRNLGERRRERRLWLLPRGRGRRAPPRRKGTNRRRGARR
jgi:hypothetical protein